MLKSARRSALALARAALPRAQRRAALAAARRLRRRAFERLGDARYSRPALNDLDRKLARYLDFDGGFFVEAGANDGYTQSNTYYLERLRGWSGILVEPIPELFKACRAERPASRVFRNALVAPDHPDDHVVMTYSNLMSVAAGAFGGDAERAREHVASGARLQDVETYQVAAPATTLTALLDLVQPPRLDFLSLDVEGYEREVLRGLDLTRYTPRYLLVESLDVAAIRPLLAPHLREVDQLTGHDYLWEARPERAEA